MIGLSGSSVWTQYLLMIFVCSQGTWVVCISSSEIRYPTNVETCLVPIVSAVDRLYSCSCLCDSTVQWCGMKLWVTLHRADESDHTVVHHMLCWMMNHPSNWFVHSFVQQISGWKSTQSPWKSRYLRSRQKPLNTVRAWTSSSIKVSTCTVTFTPAVPEILTGGLSWTGLAPPLGEDAITVSYYHSMVLWWTWLSSWSKFRSRHVKRSQRMVDPVLIMQSISLVYELQTFDLGDTRKSVWYAPTLVELLTEKFSDAIANTFNYWTHGCVRIIYLWHLKSNLHARLHPCAYARCSLEHAT